MICRYKIKFISDIEQKIRKLLVNIAVAPFVGVWIEIIVKNPLFYWCFSVAPFVGVWIEMPYLSIKYWIISVAPFVGVWIEIEVTGTIEKAKLVAPFVGVWIEI